MAAADGVTASPHLFTQLRLPRVPIATRCVSAPSLSRANQSSIKKTTRDVSSYYKQGSKIVAARVATGLSRYLPSVPTQFQSRDPAPRRPPRHRCTPVCFDTGTLTPVDDTYELWKCCMSDAWHRCTDDQCNTKTKDERGRSICILTRRILDRLHDASAVDVVDDGSLKEAKSEIDQMVDDMLENWGISSPALSLDRLTSSILFIEPYGSLQREFRLILRWILYVKCQIPQEKYPEECLDRLATQMANTWHWIRITPLRYSGQWGSMAYSSFYHVIVILYYVIKPHDLLIDRPNDEKHRVEVILCHDVALAQVLPNEKELRKLLDRVSTVETARSPYQIGKLSVSVARSAHGKSTLTPEQSIESQKMKASREFFRAILNDFVRVCSLMDITVNNRAV